MQLTFNKNEHGGLDIHLNISMIDLIEAEQYDDSDKLLIKECDKSDLISDKLMGFELMARKIESGRGYPKNR